MAFSAFRAPHVSTIALATAAVGGVAAAAAFILLRHRATSRNNFVPVGRVANIFIYPIKAIAGIEVPYADCIVTGPVYEGLKDRFMLIVKGDNFISMREEPRLGLIKMNFDNGKLTLTADGHPPLIIDACDPDELSKPSFTVRMRQFSYNAVEVSKEASRWLGAYLQKDDIRLVRIILDQEALDRGKNSPTSLVCHDESAFHVLSKASLDVLLSKLPPGSNIERKNFRPALFIDECEAHAEDHWGRMRIGDAEMALSHRTTRCLVTTVDQDAGVRTDKEPLVTLRKYRVDKSPEGIKKYTHQPLFGISTYHIKGGRVNVGDIVYAVVSPEPLL
ncbi:mitochondrial amidoxime-reducing component 1-like isoform X2 [Rhipicephalus sanguineus]|uniref:mitochondrial amidoxime-reducing component 1-like isoform X2 n=1 Tax=Rhipicephalus sanguineus TaxID=34632 RepID=UPI001893AB33|nr:mitochondrial amidoxime-reducing component 1-like isoform X2 [Rhipicephalus sanguineus]